MKQLRDEEPRESIPLTPETYQSLIGAEWMTLAAIAWQAYQERGRGLVYFGEPDLETEMLSYATEDDNEWPTSVVEKLHRYDPTSQVVFFLQWPQDWVVWIAEGSPSPPQAYEQLQMLE